MASTYPDNVLQAVQWSQDNPAMKGDAAVQAVASQPWTLASNLLSLSLPCWR
ncbi:membrane protein [Klebsiella pneumoniae]|nr:membrane protein [Klebsiella pneumoniae]